MPRMPLPKVTQLPVYHQYIPVQTICSVMLKHLVISEKKRLSHFLSFQHQYGSSCKKVRFSNTNRFGEITFWRYNLLHTHDHLQTSQQISAPVSTTKRARVPATSVSTVYSTSFTGSNCWGLGIAARTGGESASVSRPEAQIWLVVFRHQPL